MNHTVRGSDEKDKAILAHIGISIEEWLQHAYEEKARQCVDRIITIVDNRQPKKLTDHDIVSIMSHVQVDAQSEERQKKPIEQRIKLV